MDGLLLTIDTASTSASVALSHGERLLGEACVDSGRTHSDRLLILVRQLLADCGVAQDEIEACAVVSGPGSFTGLRVGVATAKGLASAIGCSLIPLSSLEVLAAALPYARLPVCALLDARKQQVYSATYDVSSGLPVCRDKEMVVAPALLAESITEPTLLVGSGAVVYRELFTARLGSMALFPPFAHHLSRVATAVPLARQRWLQGGALPAAQLQPTYIRPSEAELAAANAPARG